MNPPLVGASLAARLHDRCQAARWGLSPEQFQAALEASAAHAFGGHSASPAEVAQYTQSLHLDDLALAVACAAGLGPAWDHFVIQFRPALYRAADAIETSGAAREAADSLYGELFGLDERDGVRRPLFRYFHGRSSLGTWLRAVLAQRLVDRARARRRLEPLPDDERGGLHHRAPPVDPDRSRLLAWMRAALTAALASLSPRDRLRLACYHAQGLTLAVIGRQLGEHEATVSRQLTRTRRAIREEIERRLHIDHGLNTQAVAECWQAVLHDGGSIDVMAMLSDQPVRKNDTVDRSERQEPV